MKEIGIIEKYYHVIQKSPRKFIIEFQVGEHRVSIDNFKYIDEMSEETNAFVGDLIIDGVNVGKCSNDGKGGCASYHAYGHWKITQTIEQEVSVLENYIFPKALNLYDVIDTIAQYSLEFMAYKVMSKSRAESVIALLNKEVDKYREQYQILKSKQKPVSEPIKEEKTQEPVSVQFHGRTWQEIEKTDTRICETKFVCNHFDGDMYMDESSRQFFFLKHKGEQFVSNF